jgi:hypothetical protein
MIPAENPPNGRRRGRYKHPVPDINVREYSRLQTWRKGLERRGAATERLGVAGHDTGGIALLTVLQGAIEDGIRQHRSALDVMLFVHR